MKCHKCNESFKIIGVDNEHVGTCPKCGEKIIPTPNAFESISEAIYYCIQIGSKEPFDILNNKTKLNSYLEDTLGSSYPERNMIKAAIDSDIGATLFRAKGSSDGARKEAFDEAVDQMQRSYGTEIGIARKTVKYFTDAMGWNIVTEQPQITNENISPLSTSANSRTEKYPVTPTSNNSVSRQQVSANKNVPSAPTHSNVQNNNYTAQQPQKTEKKKGCLPFFLILTLIFLAAIAFIFLKVFLSNDKGENETSKNNTSLSQNAEISENEGVVTTDETEEPTEEATEEGLTTTEKISTTDYDATQPTTTEKSEETDKYTVRSLSQYIDYDNKNYYNLDYDSFDIDTENNVLYYALGDSIYTVNLDTGASELYTQIDTYNESTCYMCVIYNQYNYKMYCVLIDTYYSKTYLFDITTKDPELIFKITGTKGIYSFMSENTFSIVNVYSAYVKGFEKNIIDQSEKSGYILNNWVYHYTDIIGTNNVIGYSFNKILPVFKNDSYYWLESNDRSSSICYTMKSISNDAENCGKFIGKFENTISQCVTENEAYIMTDDFSIYRIDVEKLLENYDDGNPNSDYSYALELVIDGKDIKQTGVNNISEPMGLKMTKDGRFVVFDNFDNTFKIVEKK